MQGKFAYLCSAVRNLFIMDGADELSKFVFYQSESGQNGIQVIVDNESETIWASQKAVPGIFNVDRSVVNKHLSNMYETGELDKGATCAKFAQVQKEGNRAVKREIEYHNLDAIISVGYRVNSVEATAFRKWANGVLKQYLIKGFALDDGRLKQGSQLFGKDYFAELLERIREIRASERLFYQKVTDIYATAVDYDPKSETTRNFFATVQNKLHWAIHGQTASELIKNREGASKKNMGLTSWKNEKKDGKILRSDVSIAKNYLSEEELSHLNRIVSMYLDFAENIVQRQQVMRMEDWAKRLNDFLQFNEYDLLKHAGKVTAELARKI